MICSIVSRILIFHGACVCQSVLVKQEIFRRNLSCVVYIFIIYVLIQNSNSEMCHPRCVFKLYGELNSVKNATLNIWLNGGVISNGKTTCFGL